MTSGDVKNFLIYGTKNYRQQNRTNLNTFMKATQFEVLSQIAIAPKLMCDRKEEMAEDPSNCIPRAQKLPRSA